MKNKDRTCERLKRCTDKECEGAACSNYKYNHRRFRRVEQIVDLPLSDSELVEVSDNLVQLVESKNGLASELEQYKKENKAEVEQIQGQISECLRLLKKKALNGNR